MSSVDRMAWCNRALVDYLVHHRAWVASATFLLALGIAGCCLAQPYPSTDDEPLEYLPAGEEPAGRDSIRAAQPPNSIPPRNRRVQTFGAGDFRWTRERLDGTAEMITIHSGERSGERGGSKELSRIRVPGHHDPLLPREVPASYESSVSGPRLAPIVGQANNIETPGPMSPRETTNRMGLLTGPSNQLRPDTGTNSTRSSGSSNIRRASPRLPEQDPPQALAPTTNGKKTSPTQSIQFSDETDANEPTSIDADLKSHNSPVHVGFSDSSEDEEQNNEPGTELNEADDAVSSGESEPGTGDSEARVDEASDEMMIEARDPRPDERPDEQPDEQPATGDGDSLERSSEESSEGSSTDVTEPRRLEVDDRLELKEPLESELAERSRSTVRSLEHTKPLYRWARLIGFRTTAASSHSAKTSGEAQ